MYTCTHMYMCVYIYIYIYTYILYLSCFFILFGLWGHVALKCSISLYYTSAIHAMYLAMVQNEMFFYKMIQC